MIRLEYFEKSDFTQLINWIHDEELLMNWSGSMFNFPLSEASLDWYISDVNIVDKSSAFVYKVIEVETNEVIGHISLGGISKKNRSGRITRVLIGSSANKGKGYCKQMIRAILKIGFEDFKLHRIELGVYDFNSSAIKCYEKAGLSIEGTSRDCLWYKDEWWSLIEMSILEDEWRNAT
jgi:RimJ/RimL family protein N-acetyltransferase